MPDLGIAEILTIASIVATAGGTAASIYESKEAQSNEQQAQKSAQQAEAQQQLVQKREALTAAGPNAQADTSGSLTGPAGQSFVDILAGYPGSTGGAAQPGQTPTNAVSANASSSGTPNYQSILEQLKGLTGNSGSQFSGGWQPTQEPGYSPFSLAQGY
jgi:hypothetical protein